MRDEKEKVSKVGKKYTEFVLKLKSIKEKRGLTVSQIVTMVNAQDEAPIPSETTIQKVFSPHGENELYIFDTSLRALGGVLLDYYGDGSDFFEQSEELHYEQMEAYKLLIEQKNNVIQHLEMELEKQSIRAERATALETQVEQLTNTKEYLKSQCNAQAAQIERLLAIIGNLTNK